MLDLVSREEENVAGHRLSLIIILPTVINSQDELGLLRYFGELKDFC